MKEISKKIKPLQDRVLIREHIDDKEKKTSSGIIIPATAHGDKNNKRGEVVAVGSGRIENGKTIMMSVKIGDNVIFQWGDTLNIDGEEYYLLRENEILAIIK